MNLEEARNNIGAEVLLDESTKPYTDADGEYGSEFSKIIEKNKTFKILDTAGENVLITQKIGNLTNDILIKAKHLKLKPQNYKIHVPTEDESREAQELFFELGINWFCGDKILEIHPSDYIFSKDGKLSHGLGVQSRYEGVITLQELRDMVAKNKPRKEMKWQDALRVVADGKRVEFYNELCEQWWDISHLSATEVVRIEKFRLAPKRIYLNGNFTKEQLLQKAGEME